MVFLTVRPHEVKEMVSFIFICFCFFYFWKWNREQEGMLTPTTIMKILTFYSHQIESTNQWVQTEVQHSSRRKTGSVR